LASAITHQGRVELLKRVLRAALPRPVAYASYLKGLFQNEIEMRLLSRLCDERLVSIDVGAFTGTYTIGASIHSRRVIAVEPQRVQVEGLARAMPRNVRIVEAALSNVSSDGVLRTPSAEGSSMSRLDAEPSVTDGWLEIPVRLMRMDDLDVERVGFVKIDAEGHELEVLGGASRILEVDRPSFVIEAEERYRRGVVARLAELFEQAGYHGYFIYRNEVRSIREFDVVKHQDPKLLLGGHRRAYGDYINNFIFVHRNQSMRVPLGVPSAWRAVYETASACLRNAIS
jgi:FkbM family methyltransferase